MKCTHVKTIHRGPFATTAFCYACREYEVIAVHKGTEPRKQLAERKNVPKQKATAFSTDTLFAQLQARAAQQPSTSHVPAPLADSSKAGNQH